VVPAVLILPETVVEVVLEVCVLLLRQQVVVGLWNLHYQYQHRQDHIQSLLVVVEPRN
jgi:hypothetical protein